jgi:type II secretory pathway pseudopilin PulG
MKRRNGFALIDLAVAIVVIGLIASVLPIVMHANRGGAGLYVSLNNVRQITRAMHQYNIDTGGQFPMRGHQYTNGQIMDGWNSWNYGGKNCDSYSSSVVTWQAGTCDEIAYWRPLNPYLSSIQPPVPTLYRNTGSGSTWTLRQGTITKEQRLAFEMPVCQSPGDAVSYQGNTSNVNYGVPDPNGFTCYDSIGTSYVLNMLWFDSNQISFDGFTNQFDGGARNFAIAINGPQMKFSRMPSKRGDAGPPSKIVWLTDQHAPLVVTRDQFTQSPPPDPFPGEFGGDDRSVSGFLDGHVDYVHYETGVFNNNAYHLFPWLP